MSTKIIFKKGLTQKETAISLTELADNNSNEIKNTMMKTIKVFLASSEELQDEREKFGNLIRRLDDRYQNRGIHIKLLMWEDLDPCYNNVRKQEEYNAWIRESHIFLCLFYTKAGEGTLEELDVAKKENARRKKPKVMIYCRVLKEGDVEMPELIKFKQNLAHELKHYWGHFTTTDKLHLDFVMFFLNKEGDIDGVKVENGDIVFDGMHVANMDNLPFASQNEGYKDMKQRLQSLYVEVNQLWDALRLAPDLETLRKMHQQKLNEYNTLKEKFVQHQQTLFGTAKRISEMQMESVNSKLQQAIYEFETGHIEAANVILNGIEREAEHHIGQLKLDCALVHQDIEALQLKAKTLIADLSIPINQRTKQVSNLYKKIVEWSIISDYNKEKYFKLLDRYGTFLYGYGDYKQSYIIFTRQKELAKYVFGANSREIAEAYCNIGSSCIGLGDYKVAMKYLLKALVIEKKIYGENHIKTSNTLNNIGQVHVNQGKYKEALKVYEQSLYIKENLTDIDAMSLAITYINVGEVYAFLGDYTKALECSKTALELQKKELNEKDSKLASFYQAVGIVYDKLADYTNALRFQSDALMIFKETLGEYHPMVASSYSNLGLICYNKGNYSDALTYFFNALPVFKEIQRGQNPMVANIYTNIGLVYSRQKKYAESLNYHKKALSILKKKYGAEHPTMAQIYNNIGMAYFSQDDCSSALKYFLLALPIFLKYLGNNHPDVAQLYDNFSSTYVCLNEYDLALDYSFKTLAINKNKWGGDHPVIAKNYNNIGWIFQFKNNYQRALLYYKKSIKIYRAMIPENKYDIALVYNNIGMLLYAQKTHSKAILYFRKSLAYYLESNKGNAHNLAIAMAYNNIGMASYYLSRIDNAKNYLHMAVAMAEEILGTEHISTQQYKNNLNMVNESTKC